MPITVEGLQKVSDYTGSIVQQQQEQDARAMALQKDQTKQAAAAQAAQLYKQGDIKGAYSTLIAADPSFANSLFPQDKGIQQGVSYGKEKGQLQAESEYGSTPGQIAAVKSTKPIIKKDENSPTGFSMTTPQGVFPFDAYGQPATKPSAASAQPTTPGQPPAQPSLRPNEEVDPATGKTFFISPSQSKGLTTGIKNFDSEAKDLTKKFQNLAETKSLVDANVPGLGMADKITFIKTLIPAGSRLAQQEIQAVTGDQNSVQDRLAQIAERAKTGKLPPAMQDYMRAALAAVEKPALDEYNTLAHMHAARMAESTKLNPSIVMKRMLPSMPTTFQQKLQDLQTLPKTDQDAVEWAHNTLIKNPKDEDALKILRLHGF
jgi:hypothetical protein